MVEEVFWFYRELVSMMSHAFCLCELFFYFSMPIVQNYIKFALDSVLKLYFWKIYDSKFASLSTKKYICMAKTHLFNDAYRTKMANILCVCCFTEQLLVKLHILFMSMVLYKWKSVKIEIMLQSDYFKKTLRERKQYKLQGSLSLGAPVGETLFPIKLPVCSFPLSSQSS